MVSFWVCTVADGVVLLAVLSLVSRGERMEWEWEWGEQDKERTYDSVS